MAPKTKGQGKSAFVRDFIQKNPTANRKAVEEAWQKAGHEGPISSALVSNLRRQLGLIGSPGSSPKDAGGDGVPESVKSTGRKPKRRKRGRRGKASGMVAAPSPEPKPRSGGRDGALAGIERDLDHLIFKLMGVGGMESVEDELRRVRRLLYRSISE
jgi:hypothetical protein